MIIIDQLYEDELKYTEQLVRKLGTFSQIQDQKHYNQSQEHDSIAKMENCKEDEERLVDAEDNVRLICENSEESSYSFLVFLCGYINLNTFTEMVKNYAKRFEKLYNSKDFDEANKNLNGTNSIIYSALKNSIQIKSLIIFEYIINAMNQLLIPLKFTDSIIEEILIKFDIEKAGKALDIISKGNFLLCNLDNNSK